MKHWSPHELETLRRLRERFLAGTVGQRDYWRSRDELALYDATFAERIGWKWDAVLRELVARDWQPRSRRILDWGCGSGVAGRRVLACWPEQFDSLALHDRSPLALRFAAERGTSDFPNVRVEKSEAVSPGTLLVVSHVLNELAPDSFAQLLDLTRAADEIIWIEAGTHADSRRLIDLRERLLAEGRFAAVAPCTHQRMCGMLAPANARHWCHSFASPPSEIFQDARWREFGRELGIDLRALPYSFLVLAPVSSFEQPPNFSRVIGRPREGKGHLKVLSCQTEGVTELMLQKRDAPELFREIRDMEMDAPVYRWEMRDGKIVGAEERAC